MIELLNLDSSGNMTIEGTLTERSNVEKKENFRTVDGGEILDHLARVPVSTWNFKADAASARHIGPTAQDFRAAFGLGGDNKHIAPVDANGVALAAIKELNQRLQSRESEIQVTLKSKNAELEARLAAIERSLAK